MRRKVDDLQVSYQKDLGHFRYQEFLKAEKEMQMLKDAEEHVNTTEY